MKITVIKIKNFRLLKDFSLDLENDLSLIIGKNNTGKTSILTALDKFIKFSDKNQITIDDFNVDLKKQLIDIILGDKEIATKEEYKPLGISLRIFIEYDINDDLSEVGPLIMSLDPNDKNIILSFEYNINRNNLIDLKKSYEENKDIYNLDPSLFLKENFAKFFGSIQRKSLSFQDEKVFSDLIKENFNLRKVLAFNYISARRNVTNKDNDKTLSTQTSRIYKKTSETNEQEEAVNNFKQKLRETDGELSDIYGDMFSSLLEKVKKFGGIKQSETDLKIASTLQHRELLDGNTTVLYSHDTHDLPEHYNGLGYMNLISMIFEIEMILTEFKRSVDEKPAAINLFFIEEPEAHTHPQMQYIFINNIKSLLAESRIRDDGIVIHLQTVITTHSSHIVSESYFDDIKYLKKTISCNSVLSKNLKSLKDEYASKDPDENTKFQKYFKFLKQYLTLNRSELFFADKAIFMEGDTERILLPAIMKKIDQELDQDEIPLLSQNISIVEVGAHSKTFEKFIDFIGIKALIITDIDSYYEAPDFEEDGVTQKTYKNGKPIINVNLCIPSDPKAEMTSNSSLLFFHNKTRTDLGYFVDLPLASKTFSKEEGSWKQDENGTLLLAYQTEENGYHGRSFEDTFFGLNKTLLGNEADNFPSLTKKWFEKFVAVVDPIEPLEFSMNAVGSKPSLAIEILLNSKTENGKEYTNWHVPKYMKEGLEWLRKD